MATKPTVFLYPAGWSNAIKYPDVEIIDVSDGEIVFKQVAEDGKITGVRSTLPYIVEQVGTEADFE